MGTGRAVAEPKNSNCSDGAPEEILAAKQTRFSLRVMGTGRAVAELE
ncbi:MAG: hypothetical protein HDQ96_15940 [Lachnospiraceae bacterium]|nr:hypothetical protein [Lachnospiraceae bacterium]